MDFKSSNGADSVVVIGGGVIGVCTAYYLHNEGYEVTILDKGDMTDGCSYGNAGYVSPSHFIPLASPGIIAQGLRWMTNPESPFYIKPRFNRDLMSWGMKFYSAANRKNVEQGMRPLRDINMLSRKLYTSIAANEALQFAFQPQGCLMLSKTEKIAEEEEHMAVTAKSLGLNVEVLSAAALKELEPDIDLDVAGAVHYHDDAHMNPGAFMRSMISWLEEQGVRIVRNATLQGFESVNGAITKARTSVGEFSADQFVLAAGTWSQDLARSLQLNIPIQAGKGYSHTFPMPQQKLKTAAILCEARVALTPLVDQLRIGGTMEMTGINSDIHIARYKGILRSVAEYVPGYKFDLPQATQIWSGLRPVSPDGLPYIGRTKKYNNFIIASGHAMMGFGLGPATGKLVCELIQEKTPEIGLAAFSPDRYN